MSLLAGRLRTCRTRVEVPTTFRFAVFVVRVDLRHEVEVGLGAHGRLDGLSDGPLEAMHSSEPQGLRTHGDERTGKLT